MSIFTSEVNLTKYWVELSDLSPMRFTKWKDVIYKNNIDIDSDYIPFHYSESYITKALQTNQIIIDIINEEIEKLSRKILKPHMFLLTDANGVLLKVYANQEITRKLEQIRVVSGASFQLKHSGINAISMAMELNRMCLARGQDHTLKKIFSDWTCISSPIAMDIDKTFYLDFSLYKDGDPVFANVIMDQFISIIKSRIFHYAKIAGSWSSKFQQYGLTPRETEVAERWLKNNTVIQIAIDLHISAETVRTHIRNIYRKTGSNGKSDFLKLF